MMNFRLYILLYTLLVVMPLTAHTDTVIHKTLVLDFESFSVSVTPKGVLEKIRVGSEVIIDSVALSDFCSTKEKIGRVQQGSFDQDDGVQTSFAVDKDGVLIFRKAVLGSQAGERILSYTEKVHITAKGLITADYTLTMLRDATYLGFAMPVIRLILPCGKHAGHPIRVETSEGVIFSSIPGKYDPNFKIPNHCTSVEIADPSGRNRLALRTITPLLFFQDSRASKGNELLFYIFGATWTQESAVTIGQKKNLHVEIQLPLSRPGNLKLL
jgi:hypothetical protein